MIFFQNNQKLNENIELQPNFEKRTFVGLSLIILSVMILLIFRELIVKNLLVDDKFLMAMLSRDPTKFQAELSVIKREYSFLFEYRVKKALKVYQKFIHRNRLEFVVPIFLKFGARLDLYDENGETPVIYSARKNNFYFFKILFENGADVFQKDYFGLNAIQWMIINDNINFVNYITQLSNVNMFKWKMDDLAKINQLIKERAEFDVFQAIKSTNSLMLKKCYSNNPKILRVIDSEDDSLLHLAAKSNNVSMLRFLVSQKISYHLHGSFFKATPLHYAVLNENVEAINLLAEIIDINASDSLGQTALHYSSKVKNIKVTKRLIDLGADVNSYDNNDVTPFHVSIQYMNFDQAIYLYTSGARKNLIGEEKIKVRQQVNKLLCEAKELPPQEFKKYNELVNLLDEK